MEKWTKTFLKRLEQELTPYRLKGYYLDAEEEKPQMLRLISANGWTARNKTINLTVWSAE